jgi:proprotein convertase subtilisin/kexin type 5
LLYPYSNIKLKISGTDDGTRKCAICPLNCLTCDECGECITCKSTFYFLNGACTLCGDGHRIYETDKCEKCTDNNCKDCSDIKSTCKKCRSDYYLLSDSCVPCTGSNQYKILDTVDTCMQCVSGDKLSKAGNCCVACTGDTEAIFGNYCYDSNDCTSNCLKCATTTTCMTCFSGYYLMVDGTCGQCSASIPGCATCSDSMTCLTCISAEELPIFPYCECGPCLSGYFEKTLTTGKVVHYPCPANCEECTSESVCITCSSGYLKASPGDYCVSESDCINGQSCDENEENGPICQISQTTDLVTCDVENCLECLACGKCTKCQDPSYVSKSTSQCVTCSSDTQKIIGYYCYEVADCGVSNCLQCGSTNTCEDNRCASKYFRTAGGLCESCTAGCLICEDQSSCCTCDTGYKLQGSKCVSECQDGFYLVSGKNFYKEFL